jgi:putative CocE/NonD family hydrolase
MSVVRQWWDVKVPMRDDVLLSTDIYFPAGGPDGGPYPVVVARTPYDNLNPVYVEGAQYLAEHGYVSVLQDVRGRHDSDGDWVPFRNEGPDGYDTVEWAAAQPWSTGRVGTMGGSYGGWFQWALAREKPPHLTTMVSTAPGGAWMQEIPFHNGVLMLAMLGWHNLVGGRSMQKPELVTNWPEVFRHLPVREMDTLLGRRLDGWREWVDHPTLDDYWKDVRLDDDFAHVDVPVLHITGWYDGDQPGALYFHGGMCDASSAADDQVIVIGPWDHRATRVPRQVIAGVDFGPTAVIDALDLHRRWFDRWLKDMPTEPLPARARLFLTGVNSWYDGANWPPPDVAPTPLYLRSAGAANTLAGDGRLDTSAPTATEPADVFSYDPADPVPAVIDENFYAANVVETPLDHRFQHRRDDVLVYTGAPVAEALVLAGIPTVHLFASTDGPDTDWFVALHDVSPTGASMQLTEGRLRGRFRESLERETLLEPDHIYEFVVPTTAAGHVVRPGHALRLTVTSSDFPTWDRNLNTGDPIGTGIAMRVATNRVLHEPASSSYVVLPVASATSLTPCAPTTVA